MVGQVKAAALTYKDAVEIILLGPGDWSISCCCRANIAITIDIIES